MTLAQRLEDLEACLACAFGMHRACPDREVEQDDDGEPVEVCCCGAIVVPLRSVVEVEVRDGLL